MKLLTRMRKILLLLFIGLPMLLVAQEKLEFDSETNLLKIETIIYCNDSSEVDVYNAVMDWFGETFTTPEDVITYENPTTFKIKGHYFSSYHIMAGNYGYMHSISFHIKSGRFKVDISNIYNEIDPSVTLEKLVVKKDGSYKGVYKKFITDLEARANNIFTSLNNYVNNNVVDDDW